MIRPLRSLRARLRRKIVRGHLESFIQKHATNVPTLDLGCGNSRYAEYFPHRVGMDLHPGRGVSVVADGHALPVRSESFPAVLSTEMLEHARKPQTVVDEIERVLEPGGRVWLTTRFAFPLHEAPHDYFRFTAPGLAHLFRKFEQVEILPDTGPFETVGVMLQRLAFQCDFRAARLMRFACLVTARWIGSLDVLITRQHGDFLRTTQVESFLSAGFLVTAVKTSRPQSPSFANKS